MKRELVYTLDPQVEVVKKAQAGDREAFIGLMRDLELPLYRTAKSIVKHEEDCADALQETMLNAYKSLHSLREPSFFKTWIFRILINECNRILKKREKTMPFGELPVVPSISSDYEKIELWEAVEHLEENQRIVIILHYFHDMSLSQVGDVLDISLPAVKARLQRARKQLLDFFRTNREMELRHSE